jgi:hypothetical protein
VRGYEEQAMTDYVNMEQDFIRRTMELIDQYDKLVKDGCIPKEDEKKVTLLLNCLQGLLIYPQQIAHHDQRNTWLTQDQDLVKNAGPEWGIQTAYIKCPGYTSVKERCTCCGRELNENKVEPIDVEKLTLRKLIRQMRNAAAHAHFSVNDGGSNSGKIRIIEFKGEDYRSKDGSETKEGFHLEIPVEALQSFVCKLADSMLKQLSA